MKSDSLIPAPCDASSHNGTGPATQINLDAFCARLTLEYADLFANDPEYAYSASRITPETLARKMTLGLDSGSANKDGEGIKRTCKHFGIAHTYRAIRSFLKAA